MRYRCVISSILALVVLVLAGDTEADEPKKKAMDYLAVMDIRCGKGIENEVCVALTEIVIDELVKIGKYKVVDRANRDKILAEIGFQQSACVDESCSIEMGRQLGVGRMVVGSITKLGTTYLLNLQLLNVETATVDMTATEECECEINNLIKAMRKTVRKLMGEEMPAPQPQIQAPAPVPQIKAIEVEMVKIPAGEFLMGSDTGRADERPAHRVYLDEFYLDKYETTNEQYDLCVKAETCSPGERIDGMALPRQPAIIYDWNMAETYCSWAGKRLPTEAEWEKAARGEDGRTYPWGEQADCSKANYLDCKIYGTRNVGSYPSGASPYGAMDMAGNVWEWTADWHDAGYYKNSPNRNPKGPVSGKHRVLRGGSGNNNPDELRTFARYKEGTRLRYYFVGFRCAKTP